MTCYNKKMAMVVYFLDGEHRNFYNIKRVSNFPSHIVIHMEGCHNVMLNISTIDFAESATMESLEKFRDENNVEEDESDVTEDDVEDDELTLSSEEVIGAVQEIMANRKMPKRDSLGRFVSSK